VSRSLTSHISVKYQDVKYRCIEDPGVDIVGIEYGIVEEGSVAR
jgi:hypothetical protein